MKPKLFLKTWSVDQKTVDEIQAGCELLDTSNQSYTLRRLIAEGVKAIKKQQAEQA